MNEKHFFRMLDNIERIYNTRISNEAWDIIDNFMLDKDINFFKINREWFESKILKLSGYNEFDYCPIMSDGE